MTNYCLGKIMYFLGKTYVRIVGRTKNRTSVLVFQFRYKLVVSHTNLKITISISNPISPKKINHFPHFQPKNPLSTQISKNPLFSQQNSTLHHNFISQLLPNKNKESTEKSTLSSKSKNYLLYIEETHSHTIKLITHTTHPEVYIHSSITPKVNIQYALLQQNLQSNREVNIRNISTKAKIFTKR